MRVFVLLLIFLVACASTPGTRASGDSSGTVKTCQEWVAPVVDAAGVTVSPERCIGMREETSVGGNAGEPFLKATVEWMSIFLSVGALVMQALLH